MAYTLRPYQEEAVQSVLHHFRQRPDPCVVVLPTGAGKSLVIAELGRIAKGRVMVLAHVKELVEQNHGKYEALGLEGGIYAAGLKRKESEAKVTFGSVQSVVRNLDEFEEEISLLIIDECHRVSEEKETQYQQVLSHLAQINPKLRVLGLTATPYRLGFGWIYQFHARGERKSDEERYFHTCVYELSLKSLIQQGYLTAPRVVGALAAQYHFGQLEVGEEIFAEEDVKAALRKSKRATPKIVAQIVELCQEREGAMIFAATVAHAEEVMELLPEGEAALILGSTPLKQREKQIDAFKRKELKYMVNVSVLTTGFDAPHVDLIALLRPTESISLFQQIVGRGLRLAPGKEECLILDYADNGYDVFSPEVGSPRQDRDTVPVEVPCPQCGFENTFWGKVDGDGDIIEHYGRKCQGVADLYGEQVVCDYRFRFKECPHCGAENDIAARQCHKCQEYLVDPDKRLREALGMKHCMVIRCAEMFMQSYKTKKGDQALKIVYYDEDGMELTEYFRLSTPAQRRGFWMHFIRLHHKAPGLPISTENVATVLAQRHMFRAPDFVIAYKNGRFWEVKEKLFDYEGRYRKANQM